MKNFIIAPFLITLLIGVQPVAAQELDLPFETDIYAQYGYPNLYPEVDLQQVKSAQLAVYQFSLEENWLLNIVKTPNGDFKSLMEILMEAIQQKQIAAYSPQFLTQSIDDYQELTYDDLAEQLGIRSQEATLGSDEIGNEIQNTQQFDNDPQTVIAYQLSYLELSDYDNRIIARRLVGLTPLRRIYNFETQDTYIEELTTFYYPQIMGLLESSKLYDTDKTDFVISLLDFFHNTYIQNIKNIRTISLPSSMFRQDKKILTYNTLQPDKIKQVIFTDKLIDLNEIANNPLYYPLTPHNNLINLTDLIISGITNYGLTVYADELLAAMLDQTGLKNALGAGKEEVFIYNENIQDFEWIFIQADYSSQDISYYKVREIRFLDASGREIQRRPNILTAIKVDALDYFSESAFSIYYDDFRNLFAQQEVIKISAQEESRTYDELFFHSDYSYTIVDEIEIDLPIGQRFARDDISLFSQSELQRINKLPGIFQLINVYANRANNNIKDTDLYWQAIDQLVQKAIQIGSFKATDMNYITPVYFSEIINRAINSEYTDRALSYYRQIVQKYDIKEQPDAGCDLGELARQISVHLTIKDRAKEALEIMSAAEQLCPYLRSTLSVILLYNNQPDSARSILTNPDYWPDKEDVYMIQDGMFTDALDDLIKIEKAGKIHPKRYKLISLRESFDKRMEYNFPFIIEDFKHENSGDNLQYYSQSFAKMPHIMETRADTMKRLHNYQLAIDLIKQIKPQKPQKRHKSELTQLYVQKADLHHSFNQTSEAVTALKQAFVYSPNDYHVLVKLYNFGINLETLNYTCEEGRFALSRAYLALAKSDNDKQDMHTQQALQVLDELISQNPSDLYVGKKVEIINWRISKLLSNKDFAGAHKMSKNLTNNYPDQTFSYRYIPLTIAYYVGTSAADSAYRLHRFRIANDDFLMTIQLNDLKTMNEQTPLEGVEKLTDLLHFEINTELLKDTMLQKMPAQLIILAKKAQYNNNEQIQETYQATTTFLFANYPELRKYLTNTFFDSWETSNWMTDLTVSYPEVVPYANGENSNFVDTTNIIRKNYWLANLQSINDAGLMNYYSLKPLYERKTGKGKNYYHQNTTNFAPVADSIQNNQEVLLEYILFYLGQALAPDKDSYKKRAATLLKRLMKLPLDFNTQAMLPDLCQRCGIDYNWQAHLPENTKELEKLAAYYAGQGKYSDYPTLKKKYFDYALKVYQKLDSISHDNYNQETAEIKLELAYYITPEDPELGLQLLNEIRQSNPQHPHINVVLPFALAGNGQIDQAKQLIKEIKEQEIYAGIDYGLLYETYISYFEKLDKYDDAEFINYNPNFIQLIDYYKSL